MCEWGKTTQVMVKIDPALSASGRAEVREKPIDFCIAPIVKALQDGGIDMLGCCCGHGKTSGEIMLADGRLLKISSN